MSRSLDRVHQNMDRVHGPPIFTSPCKQRLLIYDHVYILVKCFVVSSFKETKFVML